MSIVEANFAGSEASRSAVLDLSAAQAYDCALDFLGAYKLTGNFTVNLEWLLFRLHALDDVAFEIGTRTPLADHRRVAFRPREDVSEERFREVILAVEQMIGVAPAPPRRDALDASPLVGALTAPWRRLTRQFSRRHH